VSDDMAMPITRAEVISAINNLHKNTSSGTTNIPPEFIIHASGDLITELLRWCDHLWQYEVLPKVAGESNAIFLHKKGSTTSLDNYRTIATGCNVCKVYFRIWANRIQEACEEANILGEIQNGFRKNRRTLDNILLLDTVIRKAQRNNSPVYIALLDITKAYDRVNRDLLWEKMVNLNFPTKLISNLKLLYQNATCALHFQGYTTEQIPMNLGLRQGCVLSPILFAIYIADLGALLEKSNLGIHIHGKKIPGAFFADDMILWGQKKELAQLLEMTGEFADAWEVEFAGNKSIVIPKLRTADNSVIRWWLGKKDNNNTHVELQEQNQGKYLGLTIQRNEPIYATHLKEVIMKARRASTLCLYLAKKTYNPVTIAKILWNTFIAPTITYGSEVIYWPRKYIQEVEEIQRMFIRKMFKLPGYVANEALYGISDIEPISHTMQKLKLNYFNYVRWGDENRWTYSAYQEQLTWAIDDGLTDADMQDIRLPVLKVKPYWLKEIIDIASRTGAYLYTPWCKLSVKQHFIRHTQEYIQHGIQSKTSLRFYDKNFVHKDSAYNLWSQAWWQKARVGALMLKYRDPHDRMCPICGVEEETLDHFLLRCARLTHQIRWIQDAPRPQNEDMLIVRSMLSESRSGSDRAEISMDIGARWRERTTITIQ